MFTPIGPGFKAPFSGRLKVRGSPDGLSDHARIAQDAANEARARIASDRNLSDLGRKAHFTDAAKPVLAGIEARRRAIKAARKALDAKAAKLFAERAPAAATESERKEAQAIWERAERMEERGQSEEAARIRRVFDNRDPDPKTYRLMVAFASLHPALVGQVGARLQEIARHRLGLDGSDLGPEGEKMADEAEDLAEEEKQLLELRSQIVKASDRATLEAAGILVRKPTTWTTAEKDAYTAKHGSDAYMELLRDELRESVSYETVTIGFEPAEAAEPEAGITPAASAA